MKHKILALTTLICCVVGLCGCDKSDNSSDSQTISDESGVIGDNKKDLVFEDFVGEYPENPISILTSSKSEIVAAINAQPNFTCAENLYVRAPESASVYDYRSYATHVPQFIYPAEQYQKDFNTLFKYFFPDREINMDYLKYSKYRGYEAEIGMIMEEGYVKDTNPLPDQLSFTYDEMPGVASGLESPVYMHHNILIGGGGLELHKGELEKLRGSTSWSGVIGTTIGTYPPKSEKSFKLLDGEMKICDAVKFFEDYVNNAPITTELPRNMATRVYDVSVKKIDTNSYAYYLRTVPEFQGVIFEQAVYGSVTHYDYDYTPATGGAFMIRCNDVDYIDSYYGIDWTFDINPCDSVIPVEEAIKITSDKLSKAVSFEVRTVEFVYVREFLKNAGGGIDIDKYEAHMTPAWRITAFNINDNLQYMCYVDAKDGGSFKYYSSDAVTEYDD